VKRKNHYFILFTFLRTVYSFKSLDPLNSVPSVNLPDLVVTSINVGMVNAKGGCLNIF